MSLASRIVDRIVLKPTRDFIDPETRRRRWVDSPAGKIEVWIYDHVATNPLEKTIAIKFPGAGGRAERGGPHPFDAWSNVSAEIWIVNMPGYGGSAGPASLRSITHAAASVANEVVRMSHNQRPLVIGNSIGCSAALYVAANFDVCGVLLRNPVPLRELILHRHLWWNGGILSGWLTRCLPANLDPVVNAGRCTAPALFVQSANDTLVPPAIQNVVIQEYRGQKRIFSAPGIDHHELLPESCRSEYQAALDWFRSTLVQ